MSYYVTNNLHHVDHFAPLQEVIQTWLKTVGVEGFGLPTPAPASERFTVTFDAHETSSPDASGHADNGAWSLPGMQVRYSAVYSIAFRTNSNMIETPWTLTHGHQAPSVHIPINEADNVDYVLVFRHMRYPKASTFSAEAARTVAAESTALATVAAEDGGYVVAKQVNVLVLEVHKGYVPNDQHTFVLVDRKPAPIFVSSDVK